MVNKSNFDGDPSVEETPPRVNMYGGVVANTSSRGHHP